MKTMTGAEAAAIVEKAVDPHTHLESAFAYQIAEGVVEYDDADKLTAFSLVDLLLDDNWGLDGWAVSQVGYETAIRRAGAALKRWRQPMADAHLAGRLTEHCVLTEDWSRLDVSAEEKALASKKFDVPIDVVANMGNWKATVAKERAALLLHEGNPEEARDLRQQARWYLINAFEQLFDCELGLDPDFELLDPETYVHEVTRAGLLEAWTVEALGHAAVVDVAADTFAGL